MSIKEVECLAYINCDGDIQIDSRFTKEEDAWEVFLGWPSKSEIEWHKEHGARIIKVKVIVPDA